MSFQNFNDFTSGNNMDYSTSSNTSFGGQSTSNNQSFENKKEIRFIKGSPKANKSTCLILSKTKDGGIIFQGAKQAGTTNDKQGRMLPKFDYSTKLFFSFSEVEMANVVLTLNKLFFQPGEVELKFPHMAGKEPKNIVLKFSLYQGKLQCGFSVYVPSNADKNFSIFLDESELEILKQNFIKQITL